MKQPVWILNSSLLILFFMSQLLLFMLQKAVPRRIAISPGGLVVTQDETNAPVNIKVIYEQDLFGTYEAPAAPVMKMEDVIAAIPKPPKNIIPEIPIEKIPTFFAPLDGILKGIIFVKDDPTSSVAVVQLKKTKEEHNYQVGDLIEDAQVLKILSNRIILIRSNGQQETLYLREEDAVHDFETEATYISKALIESSLDNKYKVNITEFLKRIHNLGDFINNLDLTTAYRGGKSFGCRIGNIGKESLGGLLGFMVDDVIVKIDGIDVSDLSSRIEIYDRILTKKTGDMIEVVIYRNNEYITLLYGLVDAQSKDIIFTKKEIHQQLMESLHSEQGYNSSSSNDSVVLQGLMSFDQEDEGLNMSTPMVMPIIRQDSLNEFDAHNKRLLHEREKLLPAVSNMKAQEKNNMLKQTNRNVIFNGMTK